MQTAEIKTSPSAKNQLQMKRQPFFSKEGQGDFFSRSNDNTNSFFSPNTIQPKLTIGQPNDKYEVEADSMADRVVQRLSESSNENASVGTTSSGIQRKCSSCEEEDKLQKKEDDFAHSDVDVQRKPIFESNAERPDSDIQTKPLTTPIIQAKCSSCEQEEKVQKKEEEELPESEGALQRKAADVPSENTPNIESRLSSSKGGGSSLPSGIQSSMGSEFGADFSGVRVHTGSQAVQMSQDIGAQAFTHGSDIYFNQGKYDTNSSSGKHLLAHELTHTVQQGSASKKIQRREFGPGGQGVPSNWRSHVRSASNATARFRLLIRAIGTNTGVSLVDKTRASARDLSLDTSHLIPYSRGNSVNYIDNLQSKRSPDGRRSLGNNAGYTLHSRGNDYVILGSAAIKPNNFYYTRVVLNHEFDHVRQRTSGNSLPRTESELDAWTTSFIRDFHRTYTLRQSGTNCFISRMTPFAPLQMYFSTSRFGRARSRAVERIRDFYTNTLAGHAAHDLVFKYWLYRSMQNPNNPQLAERLNGELNLNAEVRSTQTRAIPCSAVTATSVRFPAPPTLILPSRLNSGSESEVILRKKLGENKFESPVFNTSDNAQSSNLLQMNSATYVEKVKLKKDEELQESEIGIQTKSEDPPNGRVPDDAKVRKLGIDYKKAREKNKIFWMEGLRTYNPYNSFDANPITTPNKFAHATRRTQRYLTGSEANDSFKKRGIKIVVNGVFDINLQWAIMIIALSDNLESFRNAIANEQFELSMALKRYRRLLTTRKTGNPELLSVFFSRYWQFNMMNLTKNIALVKGKDAGPHVQAFQDALLELKYNIPKEKANGIFNQETEEALKQFQINVGFTGDAVDGILGQATLKELDFRFSNKNRRKIRSGGGQPAFSFDIPIHDFMDEDLFLHISIMHVFKVSEEEARRLTKDPPKLYFEEYKNITQSDIDIGHKGITIRRSLYEKIVGKVKEITGRSAENSSKEEAKAELFKLQETRELYKLNLQIKEIENALRLTDFSTYLRLFPVGTVTMPGTDILANHLKKKLPILKAQRDAELKRLKLDLNIFETDVEKFKKAFGKYAFQSAHDMLRENEMRARMELIRYSDVKVSNRVKKVTSQLAPLYRDAKSLWWRGVSKHVLGSPNIITDEASLVLALAGKNLLEGNLMNISAPQIMQLYQIYNQKDKPLNNFFKRSFEKEFDAFNILKPATKEYPILAFPGLNLKEKSTKYAGMDSEKFRKHLVGIIGGKDGILGSIENTRGRLNDNYMLVWELPPIIARAKRDLKIPDESVHADIIKDEVKRIEDANFWRDIGLAALGIALGIAAIASGPVGWAALAGAVVVGGVDAYIQYQDISFKRDAADTAMDPTKALSSVKPSWFWFAVSIAGLGLDMGVGKIISATAKGVRAVTRGKALVKVTKSALNDELKRLKAIGKAVDGAGNDVAKQISQIEKALAETNWKTFAKHSDILIKVKDNPDMVMRLAKALKSEPIEDAIFSLQAMKLGSGNFDNILKFYGSVGNDFISELPEVVHFIKAGELGMHPRLISEIITQPRTQQVFLDNIHDPKLLLKHWDEYLETIKTTRGLRFYEYLEQLGYSSKLRKGAKLSDEFGAVFSKLPQLTRNRRILQLTESKFLSAFNNRKLPAKAQEAIEALLKEDLIGKTADLNRATKRIMERVAPLLGGSIENVKDFRRIIDLINTSSARKIILESASSLKGQGEFSRLLALPHNARRLKDNPGILDDLIKTGPIIDDSTIDWLIKNKDIREAFVKNPGALKALKKCASPCFPLNATSKDITDIQALIAANKMSPQDYAKLNEYFYLNRKADKFRPAMEALKEPGKFKEVIGNVKLLKAKDVVSPSHWLKKGALTVKGFKRKVTGLVGKGMSPTQLQTIIQQAGIYKINGKEFMRQLSRATNFTNKRRMDTLGALFNGLASTKKSRFDIAYEMLRNIGDHGKEGVKKTDAILSKFKIDDLAYFKELAGEGLTLNALHKVATKINGSREEIIILINRAGAKAKGGNLDPDILRLARLIEELGGSGKHSISAIEDAIQQANKLADALKGAGNKVGDVIWGFTKTGSGKRKLPKKFKKPDGTVSGSEAIMHVKSRANEIAETVIKADGSIDYTQWHIIKQAIEEVDMGQILKNKIIGEVLWPKVNVLKIGKGPRIKKIVEEVSIRIKGSDPEIKAIVDAVIVKEDGSIIFKEFKVGKAKLSDNQELVYQLMEEGNTDLLEPFGAKAKMVWDDISKEFKAGKVDIVRDNQAAKTVVSKK